MTITSSGAVLFNAAAVPASGTIFIPDARGSGPVRIVIKNTGNATLTGCDVALGYDSDHMALVDTSFAGLTAGSVKQLFVDRPIHLLSISPTGATTLDITVLASQRP